MRLMAFTLLGSPIAQSLATDSFATIASAGVLVTVAAATFIYKSYHDYEEKKHRRSIEKIIRLHHKHLEKIIVPGYQDIRGFPPIYKLVNDSNVESMHLTDEEVEVIGTSSPHGTDTGLSDYREAVLSAILKLKDFYFIRTKHNDITSGVLTYLLYMLESKCLNFAG
jgi:hypothetical protein